MALADRDYYGEPEPPRTGSRLTPVVKILLVLNIGIFILDYLILASAMGGKPPLLVNGYFSIKSAIFEGRVWEFITFQFLHGSFLHILLNSVGLFIFGPWMERHFGPRFFLIYYLICGVGGAVFYTLISYLGIIPWVPTQALVGASAGIYGCVIGVAVLAPNLRVQLLFPPIELTMRQLCIGILGIATVKVLFNLSNAGGEAGHLGGAIAGFLLMRLAPVLRRPSKLSIHRPQYPRRFESKLSPRSELKLSENEEVDAILEKISEEGFQSLTDEEKEILKKAAEDKD
ncbi:MAG: rhomboid family intramembrane serine protease [Akkermansiaceae bacterium]|nr:rhomboid family intramembrane serine protease [Akkermansiaceae bacterium]